MVGGGRPRAAPPPLYTETVDFATVLLQKNPFSLSTGVWQEIQLPGVGPAVPGITPRQVLFHLPVAVPPKTFQRTRYLPRPLAGSQHLHNHGDGPVGNARGNSHAEQALHRQTDHRGGILPVPDPGMLAVGQREAYRRIIVQRLRLPAGKPIPQHGKNLPFLDVLITYGPFTDQGNGDQLVLLRKTGQLQFRHPNH